MYLIRITKEETGETELFGMNTYTSESVDSCIEKVNSGQERRSESVHEAGDHGVEGRRRVSIMENEKLRYGRWNSAPWPGWAKRGKAMEGREQPGNQSVRYNLEESTSADRRTCTPPEVRGQNTERPTMRNAWTNSGAPQGSGVGSDDRLPEANLWGDILLWLGCAPIQKDKEEKMSSSRANSTPGSHMGSGSGAIYGSTPPFTITVVSKLRNLKDEPEKDMHLITPSDKKSGEYSMELDTDHRGAVHTIGIKEISGEEEQHRKNLIEGFSKVVTLNIQQSHYQVAIDLSPKTWRVQEGKEREFMSYMAEVIAEVVQNIEEQYGMEVSLTRGAQKRQFQIFVYHAERPAKRQFEIYYRKLGGSLDSDRNATQSEEEAGTKLSPGFGSPDSSIHTRDAQFSSISPDRVFVVCQLCGSEKNGPLRSIRSPPQPTRGRLPRDYEACGSCIKVEWERNRQDREQEDEEEQRRYHEAQTRKQAADERAEQLSYIQWENHMAQARESKTRYTSSAPTDRRDRDESGSRNFSDRSQTAYPDERSPQQKGRSVKLESVIESGWERGEMTQASPPMDEHRRRKLELLSIQAKAMEETALHGKRAMETSVQNNTKNQMEWASQMVKDLTSQAQKHIDKIKSARSSVPPGSQEVGEAFLDIWRSVYEATKTAATWITNLYPWLIHIFAQLLSPVTQWIYEKEVGKALSKQAWKIEPKKCLQGMMKFWGFGYNGQPHRLTIEAIVVMCEKQRITNVKQQHASFVLAIQRMGNIQVEQKDITNYRDYTLLKAWQAIREEGKRGEALTILNEFLSYKIDLLKCRYQHAIKAYILKWRPWESSEWEPEHLAGYPNFVYYVADKWVTEHPKSKGDEVKVESIHSLIQVDDRDERSIGRDDQVIRELIEEIPTDDEWKGHAFRAQTNSFDIYSNQLDEAYSGTFSDLNSLFTWVQRVAMEVQRSVGKASTHSFPARTPMASTFKSNPRGPEKVGVHALADTTEEMGDPSEVEDIEVAGEDEFGDDWVGVHMLSSLHQQARREEVRPPSQDEERLIEDIIDQLKITQVTLDHMVSKEEWGQIDKENKPYEKMPRTWAAISSIVGKNKQQLDLSGRFKKEFQTAFENLWPSVAQLPEEAVKPHEMKCPNSVANHLNPASHTGMTCVQQLSTCPGFCEFNQRYGMAFTTDNLATRCAEEKGCEKNGTESECARTGYKNCRAQKTYYFDSAPGMLLEWWKVIEKHQQHKSGGRPIPPKERMNRLQLRSFMIGVVMCAFTVHWRKKDRN